MFDVCSVVEVDGQLFFDQVLSRSGHSTFVFSFDKKELDVRPFLEFARRLNLKYEVGFEKNSVSVDIGPDQSADDFYDGFDTLQYSDDLDFALDPLCIQH